MHHHDGDDSEQKPQDSNHDAGPSTGDYALDDAIGTRVGETKGVDEKDLG